MKISLMLFIRLLLPCFLVVGCAGVTPTPTDEIIIYDKQGDHKTAIKLFEQNIKAYELWDSTYQARSSLVSKAGDKWRMIDTVCRSYLDLRNFRTARECGNAYKKYTLPLLDQLSEEHDNVYAAYHLFESAYYLELGDFNKSFDHAKKADEFGQRFRNYFYPFTNLDLIEAYANAALSAHFIGDGDATSHYLEKLENFSDSIPLFIAIASPYNKEINVQQTKIYMAMGEYEKAKESLEDGVPFMQRLARIGGAVMSLGITEATGLGSDMEGEFNLEEHIYVAKLCLHDRNVTCAKTAYDNIINKNFKLRSWVPRDQAEASILQSPGLKYQIYHERGRVAELESNNAEALAFYTDAIDVIESQRSTIGTEASKIGFVGDKQAVYRDTVSILIRMKRYDEAFTYVERGKARALVDMLASKNKFSSATNSDVVQLLDDIESVEVKLTSSDYSQDDLQRAADRALLNKRRTHVAELQPELASLVTVNAPTVAELQQHLSAQETLVEYFGDDKELYAFILTSDGVSAIKLNGNGLNQQIRNFRAELIESGNTGYRELAKLLYSRLIQPLSNQIRGSDITIVPHGVLHYLPFNALRTETGFLIEEYNIRVLPSASVMQFLGKVRKAKGSLLALGNPDLGDSKLDLPGAEVEAIAIAKTAEGGQVLLREKATESAVKQFGGTFKYLHIASHGVFDPEAPLASGLLLTKDAANDGNLTVGEMYNLKLNADLVTLSACETALGKVANGDDVVGFTRGFLYAGASSIVSSLWKVDDEATNQLMQSFYQNLEKMDKRSALTQAQLTVKQKYQHPYYWAAFQLTGSVN